MQINRVDPNKNNFKLGFKSFKSSNNPITNINPGIIKYSILFGILKNM